MEVGRTVLPGLRVSDPVNDKLDWRAARAELRAGRADGPLVEVPNVTRRISPPPESQPAAGARVESPGKTVDGGIVVNVVDAGGVAPFTGRGVRSKYNAGDGGAGQCGRAVLHGSNNAVHFAGCTGRNRAGEHYSRV